MDLHFTVNLNNGSLNVKGQSFHAVSANADAAIETVLKQQDADFFDDFHSVYQDNPVPYVSGKYGAPMGRMGSPLDHDHLERYNAWTAKHVPLDEGGYDEGGCYWGLRMNGTRLYSVQDGIGNICFVDARSESHALEIAEEL